MTKSILSDDMFNFIRRISKASFQKFFKENETFVLANKAVSLRDSHLEEFYRS